MDYMPMKAPMHINWNFTYKCNFNCEHCYSRKRLDVDELTKEQKLIVASNIARNKVFDVNLGGGEPLLCEDCFDVIRYLSDNNVYVSLSTNGWNLNDETVRQLKAVGLSGVSVSIDNSESAKHDFNRNRDGSWLSACNSIRMYSKAGFRVLISTTITSQNYDSLENIIQLAIRLNAAGVDFKRLKTTGNAFYRHDLELNENQKFELYKNIIEWKNKYPININLVYGSEFVDGIDSGCPCGKTSLSIMCNGDISPCIYNTYRIGNALNDDLHEIWCFSDSLNFLRSHFKCMGLAQIGVNMYYYNDKILFQKDYRIADECSISDYFLMIDQLSDNTGDTVDPSLVAVIAINGIPYSLNITGAIIVEEIMLGKCIAEIRTIFTRLFKISDEKAASDILSFADELVSMGVLNRGAE